MGMMGKLKETQEKIKAAKVRLDTVSVEEHSLDGLVKVVLTANRTIKSIEISDALLLEKKRLEDSLIITLNKAIEKATQINEAQLGAVAKECMPSIPGMDGFFK